VRKEWITLRDNRNTINVNTETGIEVEKKEKYHTNCTCTIERSKILTLENGPPQCSKTIGQRTKAPDN